MIFFGFQGLRGVDRLLFPVFKFKEQKEKAENPGTLKLFILSISKRQYNDAHIHLYRQQAG